MIFWRRKWTVPAKVAVDSNREKPLSRPTTAGTGGTGERGSSKKRRILGRDISKYTPSQGSDHWTLPYAMRVRLKRISSLPLLLDDSLFEPPFAETNTVAGVAIYFVFPLRWDQVLRLRRDAWSIVSNGWEHKQKLSTSLPLNERGMGGVDATYPVCV